jgi:hypothetical protein
MCSLQFIISHEHNYTRPKHYYLVIQYTNQADLVLDIA